MQRISSGQTFFMKRIFPCLWLGVIGIGLVVAIFAPISATRNPAVHVPPPYFFLIVPVIMLIFGVVLFRKLLWDLADSVDDARDYLLVRRGSVEQRVMLANVMNVSMSQFTNPPRLTLRLRKAGPLGDEIVFIPKSTGLRMNPFRRNEIAESLMRRVDAVRTPGEQG
ncbi:MAG: hypothetical protein ABI846_12365 [Rudaea sp.]